MNKKYTYIFVFFLIAVSAIAFCRVTGNDFIVSSDDSSYITRNNYVQSGLNTESIKWAFTTTFFGYWHPLTIFLYMLNWSIFGVNPFGHHLVNLFLHIGVVILLFLFLNKTTNSIWSSAFAAAFFALHPLRVELVASAGELKDPLSMFFGLASIYAYTFYAEKMKISRYFLCLIFFILSLMSKPTLVTLPFLLMLLDYWPLGRWQKAMDEPAGNRFKIASKLIWEKVPFIFLTIAVSIVTLWVTNKTGTVVPLDYLPFLKRIDNAIVSYAAYLGKTFWPVNLSMWYTYNLFLPLWEVIVALIILAAITSVVLYYIKKLPFLFTGWFWYLGTLIPVIGLIQRSTAAMADRYTYLPSIGISIMLAWGIPSLIKNEEVRKKILLPSAITVLTILILLTCKQCGYWKNDIVLWSHTLKVTKDNYLAHTNMGTALFFQGKNKESIEHYNEAIRINPDCIYAYNNRGIVYGYRRQYQLAIKDFNECILRMPDYAEAYYNRGSVYAQLGQFKNAIEDFNKAIRLKPDYAEAYNNRGNIYGQHGQYQLAIEDFNKVIGMNPDHIKAYNNRGLAFSELGQYQNAIEDFNKAILLKSDYASAYNNRANVYFKQGDSVSGCRDAQKACELGNCKVLEYANSRGLCR